MGKRTKKGLEGRSVWVMDFKQNVVSKPCNNILYEIREDEGNYFRVFYYGVCSVFSAPSLEECISYVEKKVGRKLETTV